MSFISCMIVLTRVYRAFLNRGSESVHSCVFHGLRIKAFNISPLSYDVGCSLSYMASIVLRFLVYPICWAFLNHERILYFIDCFFSIYWNDHIIFFIIHSIKCGVSHLCVLNHPCTPWINPSWLWCMIFIICCWIWFPNILLRVFVFIFIRDIGL